MRERPDASDVMGTSLGHDEINDPSTRPGNKSAGKERALSWMESRPFRKVTLLGDRKEELGGTNGKIMKGTIEG